MAQLVDFFPTSICRWLNNCDWKCARVFENLNHLHWIFWYTFRFRISWGVLRTSSAALLCFFSSWLFSLCALCATATVDFSVRWNRYFFICIFSSSGSYSVSTPESFLFMMIEFFFFVHDSWSCRVDLEWMLRDRHPIDFVIIFFSCYLKSSKSVCSLRMWNIAQCFHKNNSFVIVNLFNRKKTRERRMFNLFVSLFGWCACASAWAWFYTWGSVPSSPSHAKLCANTNRVPMWSSWTIESRQKWMKKKKKKTN